MENKMRQMMDDQRFFENPRLARMIREAEGRYSKRELSLDELSMVNAAGNDDQDVLSGILQKIKDQEGRVN